MALGDLSWSFFIVFSQVDVIEYDINWYGSLMFLDSGNLAFVFSKGSNSVADSEFVNQGK